MTSELLSEYLLVGMSYGVYMPLRLISFHPGFDEISALSPKKHLSASSSPLSHQHIHAVV